MDILHLIDRLEAILNEGSHPPFVKKVMIDEQRAWEVIDQMRIAIPDEVKKAKRTIQERDRIMAQANEEAARVVELAKEDAAQLTIDHDIAKSAQNRANQIIERAQREAEQLRADADEYSLQVLTSLEADLAKQLTVSRNGLMKLQSDRAAREAQAGSEEQSGAATTPSAASTNRS
jgi:cell division septum initiation protein DivIVA